MRVPLIVDLKPAPGFAAGGDRAVFDFDQKQGIRRLGIGPGGGDPDRAGRRTADTQIAADVQEHLTHARRWLERGIAGAFDDKSLGDAVQTERAV